jgi:hypothetical protein
VGCLLRLAPVSATALRWHARYCAEVPDVGFEEAQAALACLAGLTGRRPKAAAEALAALVHRRGLKQAGEASTTMFLCWPIVSRVSVSFECSPRTASLQACSTVMRRVNFPKLVARPSRRSRHGSPAATTAAPN